MGAVESRSITLDGKKIAYDFTYKSVRNINLRIRADGSMAVSAPVGCPQEKVRAFLHSRSAWILRAIGRAEERNRQKPACPPSPAVPYEGATALLFGRIYTLHLCIGRKREVYTEGDRLILCCDADASDSVRKKLLRAFYTTQLKEATERIVAEYLPHFAGSRAAPLRTVSYRAMRSAWGRCLKSSGLITLNLRLVYAVPAAVEYVIVHEMTHLIHADHSQKFYKELAKRLPDHKEKKALLRGVDARAEDVFSQ